MYIYNQETRCCFIGRAGGAEWRRWHRWRERTVGQRVWRNPCRILRCVRASPALSSYSGAVATKSKAVKRERRRKDHDHDHHALAFFFSPSPLSLLLTAEHALYLFRVLVKALGHYFPPRTALESLSHGIQIGLAPRNEYAFHSVLLSGDVDAFV